MEIEAEATEEELALGGSQPGQDIITSTTTTTITTVVNGLSSNHDNGAKFLVYEEGESSFRSFALKNGGDNFDDSKTSPEHVILDLTAAASDIQDAAEINPEVEDHFKTDLYLETVCTKPENYNFYCPNCKACIEKVLIRNEEEMRCPTCFECVKFIGSWVLQKFTGEKSEGPVRPQPTLPGTNPEANVVILEDNSLKQETLIKLPGSPQPTPPGTNPEVSVIVLEDNSLKQGTLIKLPGSLQPTPPGTNPEASVVILEDNSLKQETLIKSPVSPLPLPLQPPPPNSHIKWEILKSIVYGGLIESITSLSIVTSAASSAAATLDIVALALANLIGGLFVIAHNLRELKNDEYRVASNQEGEQVDRYEEIFGQKGNFILHASVAVLSFLVFGLVPPLVYGFSFYESDNQYFKLAAVAAASLLCITLLAIAKASIQNPPVSKYITVLHYLAIGVGASGISYLVGYLVGKLFEKLGLFKSTVAVTLPLPEMSSVKHPWGSY